MNSYKSLFMPLVFILGLVFVIIIPVIIGLDICQLDWLTDHIVISIVKPVAIILVISLYLKQNPQSL
jgi:hypothetical protein